MFAKREQILWPVFCLLLIISSVVSDKNERMGFGEKSCQMQAKGPCQKLEVTTCFGVKLPYAYTSPELVNENFTQKQLQNEMMRWEGLGSAPKCWAIVQPLLCAYYMPKCQDGLIDLPSQEMCKVTRNPCRVVEEATKQWPEFLRCDEHSKFPSNCKNDFRELKFNMSNSAKCMEPMKEVQSEFNYYEGFEGCGLKCQDPLYTDEDHAKASTLIWYLGIVAMILNTLVVFTYKMDWKSSSQYPSIIIFYINLASLGMYLAWFLQFLPRSKEDIVCRKDGTIRRNEPVDNENVFCVVVSSCIYFLKMFILAWLMVFAYLWNMTCSAVGRIQERIDKQNAYFWTFAFVFPLILTILCASFKRIDGSSIYGICFVGFYEPTYRITFVLVPVGLACFIIEFFFMKGTYNLLSLYLSSPAYIPPQGRPKIKAKIYQGLMFSLLAAVLTIAAFVLQLISMRQYPQYEKSLRESLLCNMNLTDIAECAAAEKPDMTIVFGNIIVAFCDGILTSFLAWTSASINIWKRSFRRICNSDESEENNTVPRKHILISKAYAKRNQLQTNGRLSMSLYSTHEDPVGLNHLLDPNRLCQNDDDPEQSNQMSQTNGDSDWAASIPHFVTRRGALVPPSSNSVSCMSEDSRRPSYDSALSEQNAAKHFQGSSSGLDYKSHSRREWFRMARRSRSTKAWRYPWRRSSNRGSSSSLESNPGSQILPAITALIDKRQQSGDDNLVNVVPNNQVNFKRPIILRELAIQTSIEQLYSPSAKSPKNCNLSNNLSVDKATQSSLLSLHEIGTQTKKSATKKKDRKDKLQKDNESKGHNDKTASTTTATATEAEDPVLKLLIPKIN